MRRYMYQEEPQKHYDNTPWEGKKNGCEI